jgi:hypothetical protein
VHADVGGGYPETESGLSKFPLAWMIDEAVRHGLQINAGLRDGLVFGKPYFKSKYQYVAPDAAAQLHQSLTGTWKPLELIPKPVRLEEWPDRIKLGSFYIPRGEPRMIENATMKPLVHRSVIDRMGSTVGYDPVNFPKDHGVEPWPYMSAANATADTQPPSA